MTFLKTAKVVLLERQVRPGAESTHIVSTSRITGRAGESPVDVSVREEAVIKQTPYGWPVARLEWTVEPASTAGRYLPHTVQTGPRTRLPPPLERQERRLIP